MSEFFDEWASCNSVMTSVVRVEIPGETASMNNFSDISGASLVADTAFPRGAGSRRGRLAHDASCSVSLPWTIHAQRGALFPLSFPSSQPVSALGCGGEHIDPRPDLSRRAALEMLMGPEVVVEIPCVSQRPVERCGILDGMLKKQPFHGADESLDAVVLPGTARVRALMLDAQEPQPPAQTPRREDGFVVGAQKSRAAILTAYGGGEEKGVRNRFKKR